MSEWDSVWTGATLATMAGDTPFGLIDDGAVAVKDEVIAWVGRTAELPGPADDLADETIDCDGRVVTPGLVDCHTHLVHDGDGLADFEILVAGGSRADMEAAGAGVRGLVMATRAADEERLLRVSRQRVGQLVAAGVTTIESKSGAGLDLETELRQMRVSRRLDRDLPVTVVSTFLGAHGLAPEYEGRRDDYVDFLCDTVLPAAVEANLADAVDGFCDRVGFTHAQIERLFDRATAFGLPVKLHADQYSDFGAGALVARYRGLSADHLEYASTETIRAMAEAGTVATLLPGAHWLLGETQRPPVAAFRGHGVTMALATNCNPVSSPTTMPTMMMHMACRLFGLTAEEAVRGFTTAGAAALGRSDTRGSIEPGKRADLVLWDVTRPAELAARIATNPCLVVMAGGTIAHRAAPLPFDEERGP